MSSSKYLKIKNETKEEQGLNQDHVVIYKNGEKLVTFENEISAAEVCKYVDSMQDSGVYNVILYSKKNKKHYFTNFETTQVPPGEYDVYEFMQTFSATSDYFMRESQLIGKRVKDQDQKDQAKAEISSLDSSGKSTSS